MSDFIQETPNVATHWCPGCSPERDPLREVLETRWCTARAPASAGAEDANVPQQGYMAGSNEAGEDGALWCEFFHRKARLLTGGAR